MATNDYRTLVRRCPGVALSATAAILMLVFGAVLAPADDSVATLSPDEWSPDLRYTEVQAEGGAADQESGDQPGMFARFRSWRLQRIAGTDAWVYAGPAAVWVNLQDTRMTPLVYGGPGAGICFFDEVVRERWLRAASLRARYALLQGAVPTGVSYQNIGAEVDAAVLYRVPDTRLAAGGALHGGTNLRIYDRLSNSAFNADYVVSMETATTWHVPFTLFGRTLDWHVRGQTPLFSWVGRQPEYAVSGFASLWTPPWRFIRLRVETGLTWHLRWSAENLGRLTYGWDFYALNELDGLHALRVGTHTLTLSLGTKRM